MNFSTAPAPGLPRLVLIGPALVRQDEEAITRRVDQ